MKEKTLLFVYGTLMENERNHAYLKDSQFVGEGIMEGYTLLELSGYPGMISKENGCVRGEIYEMDESIKADLDRLEGDEYEYHEGIAMMNGKKVKVHFYEYKNLRSIQMPALVHQYKWISNRARKDLVWYVCFGSNLLSERFDIYIQATQSKSKPLMSKTKILPYELYFAKQSSRWDEKGVAFLDVHSKGMTYGKAYLIHQDQIKDIQKKEGRIWYDCIHEMGEDEYGIPYVTLTHSTRYDENAPSKEYLEVLGAGLQETYDFDVEKIESYLKMTDLDMSQKHIDKILESKGDKKMKFETLDFRKEVNHEKLSAMEKEILKYEFFDIKNLKNEEKASFEDMLEDFVKMQGEYGFFPLVVDNYIPNDCMYYYNRKPTYIILSLLMQNGNPKHEEVIQKALDGCLLSKFYGTSYEAEMQQMENLWMLLKAGLLFYANQDMWNLIYHILQNAKNTMTRTNNEGMKCACENVIRFFKGVC